MERSSASRRSTWRLSCARRPRAALAPPLRRAAQGAPGVGLGEHRPLRPENRIFAHMRTYARDIVLCVHNSRGTAQAVELTLAFGGQYSRRDLRPHPFLEDRRAALTAHARPARLLLVPAARSGGRRQIEQDRRAASALSRRARLWADRGERWSGSKREDLERECPTSAPHRVAATTSSRSSRFATPEDPTTCTTCHSGCRQRRRLGRAGDRGGADRVSTTQPRHLLTELVADGRAGRAGESLDLGEAMIVLASPAYVPERPRRSGPSASSSRPVRWSSTSGTCSSSNVGSRRA